jgi:S-DNA-T family DNA segregation ATPase FtsK/SpoIIIE
MTKRSSTRRTTSKRTSRRKTRRKSSRSRRKPPSLPTIDLTLDQQLDILGYALLAIAGFTLLSFLSANHGVITGKWLELLRQGFGWGAYLTPLFVGAIGLWLVLRDFGDRLPHLTPPQIVGVLLGYLALLTTLHLLAASVLFDGDAYTTLRLTAEAGLGGGYLGAELSWLLLDGLGGVGATVAMITWWLIVIALVFGITVEDAVQAVQAMWKLRQPRGPIDTLPPPTGTAPDRRVFRPDTAPGRATPMPRPATLSPSSPAAPVPSPLVSPSQLIGSDQVWQCPSLDDILEPGNDHDIGAEILRQQARTIEHTLRDLGAPVRVQETNPGPVVTQFGIEPLVVSHVYAKCGNCNKSFSFDTADVESDTAALICPHCESTNAQVADVKENKVKVSRIRGLADDLALALEAKTLRVEAPIPGKGLIGIEVPNPVVSLVALRDILESEEFAELDSPLRLCMGQDVSGHPVVADLTVMPHLLIAGTTGSGKSVCINAIIAALLLQRTPNELKFLMVDPKRVELIGYEGIPHLLSKVVVDMERVTSALQWVLREMDGRYRRFSKARATHIRDYNSRVAPSMGEKPLPYIVVVIDELADLMMMAPQETERSLCRIAQMARATGIHLVIATQRPSVDVVTGLIKANFPARVAFNVASSVDSRVILDMPGAEQLLGRGDMLFLPPDVATPLRLQGAHVSDEELRRLVYYWKGQGRSEAVPSEKPVQQPLWEEMRQQEQQVQFEDELLPDVIDLVLREQRASISLLQRKLRIGYTRGSRIMDILERHGVVGPQPSGGRAREVFPGAARALLHPEKK